MELEFTADAEIGDAELVIHLDVEGLAALLKAIEAAISTGRGRLMSPASDGSGIIVSSGSPGTFGNVTVTFVNRPGRSDDREPTSGPDPVRVAHSPVPEMQN